MIKELNKINKKVDLFIEEVEGYLKNQKISFNQRFLFFKELPLKYKFHEEFILTKEKGYPAIDLILQSD